MTFLVRYSSGGSHQVTEQGSPSAEHTLRKSRQRSADSLTAQFQSSFGVKEQHKTCSRGPASSGFPSSNSSCSCLRGPGLTALFFFFFLRYQSGFARFSFIFISFSINLNFRLLGHFLVLIVWTHRPNSCYMRTFAYLLIFHTTWFKYWRSCKVSYFKLAIYNQRTLYASQ